MKKLVLSLILLCVVKLCAEDPNIIIIFTDDAGYSDLGVHSFHAPAGSDSNNFVTPNIDSIANSGVRFTSGYVSVASCAPSRHGLITGRYQQRFGADNNFTFALPTAHLPLDQHTIGDTMGLNGYYSIMIGKWHLGFYPGITAPNARGFDYFFGFHGGSRTYFYDPESRSDRILYENGLPAEGIENYSFLTDLLTDKALGAIDDHVSSDSGKPFCALLAYNTPHAPFEATDEWLQAADAVATSTGIAYENDDRRAVAAMQMNLDYNIGKILSKLEDLSLTENTIIVYTNDNGGVSPGVPIMKNHPLSGGKGSINEGGLRVPYFVKWPVRIPAGQVINTPVSTIDLLATFVDACDGDLISGQKLDGESLLPVVDGSGGTLSRESLFFRLGGHDPTNGIWAIRRGDWKLLQSGSNVPELYNVSIDIEEANDLASREPYIVNDLLARHRLWENELIRPIRPFNATENGYLIPSGDISIDEAYPFPENGFYDVTSATGDGYLLAVEREPFDLAVDFQFRFKMNFQDDLIGQDEQDFVIDLTDIAGGADDWAAGVSKTFYTTSGVELATVGAVASEANGASFAIGAPTKAGAVVGDTSTVPLAGGELIWNWTITTPIDVETKSLRLETTDPLIGGGTNSFDENVRFAVDGGALLSSLETGVVPNLGGLGQNFGFWNSPNGGETSSLIGVWDGGGITAVQYRYFMSLPVDPGVATISQDIGKLELTVEVVDEALVSATNKNGYVTLSAGSTGNRVTMGYDVDTEELVITESAGGESRLNVGELSTDEHGSTELLVSYKASTAELVLIRGKHILRHTLTGTTGPLDYAGFQVNSARTIFSNLYREQDRDGDGIGDLWEIEHVNSLDIMDGSSNSDNDSESDLAEYLSLTDPLDGNSFFGIDDRWTEGNNFNFSWQASPLLPLRVGSSPDLTTWTLLDEVYSGSGSLENSEPNDFPYYFYRMQLHSIHE